MDAQPKARSTDKVFNREAFPARSVIFHEGDQGNCAWYIEAGTVLIVKKGPAGETLLGTLRAGAIFGELALIDDSPRMASAITIDPCVLMPIAGHYIRDRVAAADPFVARLLRILVQNVRSITDRHVSSLERVPPIADTVARQILASAREK